MPIEYTGCRLCKSPKIQMRMDFGTTAFANNYLEDETEHEPTAPLRVFQCENCGSVQLKDTVSPLILFQNYLYESSTSAAFRNHFKEYAEHIKDLFNLRRGDLVVDIGSNDGIFLKPLKELGFRVFGIEPAKNLAAKAEKQGLLTYTCFFNKQEAEVARKVHGPARVIACNNCFAHIDDLDEIVESVKLLLHPDGVFVFENAYLLDTIENLYFDQFYHEHIFYHSLRPLVQFFKSHGMDVFRFERNRIQGGSFRCFVGFKGKHSIDLSVMNSWINEKDSAIYTSEGFRIFTYKVNKLREKTLKFLSQVKSGGKTVCAFGAPAKFTTFSHVFDITKDLIDFVIDDSPAKQGLFTPGNHLPIVSSSWLYDKKPDYCLITAWNFADSIMENHKKYKEQGGRFVIPMPELKIV
jgi:SAM-dependent methyltransferase